MFFKLNSQAAYFNCKFSVFMKGLHGAFCAKSNNLANDHSLYRNKIQEYQLRSNGILKSIKNVILIPLNRLKN